MAVNPIAACEELSTREYFFVRVCIGIGPHRAVGTRVDNGGNVNDRYAVF